MTHEHIGDLEAFKAANILLINIDHYKRSYHCLRDDLADFIADMDGKVTAHELIAAQEKGDE